MCVLCSRGIGNMRAEDIKYTIDKEDRLKERKGSTKKKNLLKA